MRTIISVSIMAMILAVLSISTSFAGPVSIPGMVEVKASVQASPPNWAVKQRYLMDAMNDAAVLYLDKFSYRGGSLRDHGKLDDDYECFINWPLFYIMGGDEKILDWSLDAYNAITRQWTYQHQKSVQKEFVKHYDMLHLSEGYVGFQYFGLADPEIPENMDRAKRFAGFYMNEDPEAKNFDPVHKIIRSPQTGSMGPAFEGDCLYMLRYGHATLYPVVKELEQGWWENPKRLAEIQKIYNRVVMSGDVPMNLAITGLVTHAYIYTGEEKYKKWVLDYVDAWMDRIKQNNGVIPDNIGLCGKVGENRKGQWWGGFFGWNGRYSNEMIFKSLITASECAYLISRDPKYLDLLRSQVDMLLSHAETRDGNLLIPYKYGPGGWEDFRPMEPYILGHLWRASMDSKDWAKIELVRKGTRNNPYAYGYAESPNPPAPGAEMWHPDGTLFDWNKVYNDLGGNKYRLNESPHLGYLGGINPGWPDAILDAEYDHFTRNVERIRSSYEHSWGSQTLLSQNPIITTGLAQMTMGAQFTCFNGGLLMARVRYFDTERARPGLPEDVAALVEKLEANGTVVQLVNLNAIETRRLIIQAGAFGEHEFTTVSFRTETKDKEEQKSYSDESVTVNKTYFAVELPPATSIELHIGMKRFVNQPTYTFPWQKTAK